MGISSEVKDDIFIRTIVPNIFSSDCEDSDSESEEDYFESEFEYKSNPSLEDNSDNNKIVIEHLTSTSRELVGLQVWRGAFLLGDFILHHFQQFKDKNVLELASGVGLTSIVASKVAKHVVATDVNRGNILPLLEANIKKNSACDETKKCDNVKVCELDFFWDNYPDELLQNLQESDIILAADVVYIESVTRNFVKTLRQIFQTSPKPKVAYIAIEKRCETKKGGEIIAPMFEFFVKCVQELHNVEINDKKVLVEQLIIDFPKYFVYTRVAELTLWKISFC